MSLLHDVWAYCSCYEVPRNYAIWAGVGLLAATMNRRIYVRQGDLKHHGNMYICLVGEQGGKKSTAKDFVRDWYVSTFPDMPVGASVQSREDIIKYLASDESTRAFKNEDDVLIEYHPYVFFINELKNFLSFNPSGMVDFLTDIYDRPYFDARTLKRGAEPIINPSITILACETPTWIVDKLKTNIISGGFSRRMVYVYEIETPEIAVQIAKPRPKVTPEARKAEKRIKDHLAVIGGISGEFRWTPEGEKFFDEWYMHNRKTLPEDPVVRGYRRTKDGLLLKTAMLTAMAYPVPKMLLTGDLFEEALAMLDAIEVNMPKLSVAAGRNILAVPQQKILDILENNNGCLPEKEVMRRMGGDLSPMEMLSVIRFLKDTEQIFAVNRQIPGTNPPALRVVLYTREGLKRSKV
jgi:hypothetical protein